MSRLVARAPCPNCVSNVSAAKFNLSVVAHDFDRCSMDTRVREMPGRECVEVATVRRTVHSSCLVFLTPYIYLTNALCYLI